MTLMDFRPDSRGDVALKIPFDDPPAMAIPCRQQNRRAERLMLEKLRSMKQQCFGSCLVFIVGLQHGKLQQVPGGNMVGGRLGSIMVIADAEQFPSSNLRTHDIALLRFAPEPQVKLALQFQSELQPTAVREISVQLNQCIGRWNTSQVCDISSFNQSIGGWNASQIRGVRLMFAEDSSFYQALAAGSHHFSSA